MKGTGQGYDAELFHPGSGNEVLPGQLFLEPPGLVFRSGANVVPVAVEDLLIEPAPDEGRLYFRDRTTPGLRIFTGDQSILEAEIPGRPGTIRHHLEQAATRREVLRRLRILACTVAACFLLGWLGVLATHLMVLSLVAEVPPAWEQKFGDEHIAELKREGVLLEDSNRIAQLTLLAAPLMRVIPHGPEFKFHIVASDVPNAFALPGGHIVVNSGLLRLGDNDELLGVIAHESAHITRKHHARKIISAAGPFLIFGAFTHSRNGLMNLVGEGSALILIQGFSKEYELEADEAGWNYLVAANIDPRGMIGIFKKFKVEEAGRKVSGEIPLAFQSHPALDKRIARLQAKWEKLPRQGGFIELPPVDLRPR